MPKQTPAQILGRQGERWFQSILPPEWVFTRPSEDFGIDGTVAIGDSHAMTPVEFGVQVKASSRWLIQGEYIVVPGIAIETIRYWAGRLLPTLLVLHDAQNTTGYFAWTADLISLCDLEESSGTTMSLKVSRSNLFSNTCWAGLKQQATMYHQRLASAFATLSDARPLLRTIRALAQALQLLVIPKNMPGRSNDEAMLCRVADIVAHREVVISLRTLAARFDPGHGLHTSLREAAEMYRSICAGFLNPFDDILDGTGTGVAVWVNDERMIQAHPQLVSIVTGLMVGLSTLAIPEFSTSRPNVGRKSGRH
ncbi:MAG: DUF4365 domain-containing protein [Candidatus Solibacter sp.]